MLEFDFSGVDDNKQREYLKERIYWYYDLVFPNEKPKVKFIFTNKDFKERLIEFNEDFTDEDFTDVAGKVVFDGEFYNVIFNKEYEFNLAEIYTSNFINCEIVLSHEIQHIYNQFIGRDLYLEDRFTKLAYYLWDEYSAFLKSKSKEKEIYECLNENLIEKMEKIILYKEENYKNSIIECIESSVGMEKEYEKEDNIYRLLYLIIEYKASNDSYNIKTNLEWLYDCLEKNRVNSIYDTVNSILNYDKNRTYGNLELAGNTIQTMYNICYNITNI